MPLYSDLLLNGEGKISRGKKKLYEYIFDFFKGVAFKLKIILLENWKEGKCLMQVRYLGRETKRRK